MTVKCDLTCIQTIKCFHYFILFLSIYFDHIWVICGLQILSRLQLPWSSIVYFLCRDYRSWSPPISHLSTLNLDEHLYPAYSTSLRLVYTNRTNKSTKVIATKSSAKQEAYILWKVSLHFPGLTVFHRVPQQRQWGLPKIWLHQDYPDHLTTVLCSHHHKLKKSFQKC